MTTFLLIRHAAHDLLGRTLAGRAADVHLNSQGRTETEQLARRLAKTPIEHIYTSPLERAQETAWPIAAALSRAMRIHSGIDEINFGDWTAMDFPKLDPLPDWQLWNTTRSRARCPNGESMQEVQARVVHTLTSLSQAHPTGHLALVSHGDVIKAALMFFLSIPLDCIHGFEISPASLSILTLNSGHAHVLLMNDTAHFQMTC